MSHEYIDITTGACRIRGQDHSPVTVKLEHGGFITTTAGSKTETKKHKIVDRYLSPELFWSTDGVDI